MINWLKKWLEPKPFKQGFLPKKEGHRVFFMEFGNPSGSPVLVFHGGPGGGCRAGHANFANLKKCRVIMFDQRGCNCSLPLGRLENNDTSSLLDDAVRLLNYLNVNEKVVLRGSSWGSTLALLFAEKYPDKVRKLLLSQIFMADADSAFWEFEGNRFFCPEFVEELERKAKGKGEAVPAWFASEINSKSMKKQLDAANYYGWYERLCGNLEPAWNDLKTLSEKELAEYRIFMHYRVNGFMLKPDQIMKNIRKIKHIPAVIIHNRLDFVCPPKGAYKLHKALPNSRLIMVPERGHVGRKLYEMINHEFKRELQN